MKAQALVLCGLLVGVSAMAQGQSRAQDGEDTYLLYTITYAESCTWIDDLLRKTCARIGPHLSEKNQKLCVLPERPYRERIARTYPAFKERNRVRLKEIEPKVAKVIASSRAGLEGQFAQVVAGKVSMLDLESLNRELGDKCATIETEWLPQNPKPK